MFLSSRRTWIAFAVAAVFTGSPAFAGGCSWTTPPTAVSFGVYSVFGTVDSASSAQFMFNCQPFQYVNIKLTRGSANQYVPTRWMTSGSNTANYNLFLDSTGNQIWGDANGGSYTYDTYNSLPRAKDFTDNIYGIMPFGQDLAAGSYQDTIFATLSYSNSQFGTYTALAPVPIAISATVNPECRVDTFNLLLGQYDPFSASPLTQTSSVKVYCTKTTTATLISLDNGANASGLQKRMAGSGAFLNYNATLAASSGTSTSSLVPIGGGITLNGTVPPLQDVPIGSYVDTLQTLVNY
jgi:spore coat protein U-like protein